MSLVINGNTKLIIIPIIPKKIRITLFNIFLETIGISKLTINAIIPLIVVT